MDEIERSWARYVVLLVVVEVAINAILLWGFHFHWGWLVNAVFWTPLLFWIGLQHGRMRRDRETR